MKIIRDNKKYQYQLLKYLPDRVSGEFVTIGIVMFCPEEKFVKCKFVENMERAKRFFDGCGYNPDRIIPTIKHIEDEINLQKEKLGDEFFSKFTTLEALTQSILPRDDSALFFTQSHGGIDSNINSAFEHLCSIRVFHFLKTKNDTTTANR